MQWLKLHIRVAALEQGGRRLMHRFEFPDDRTVVCNVYFDDDGSNPLEQSSQMERLDIYQGWMDIGKDIVESALRAAELPSDFVWCPTLHFILRVSYGLGSSIVHESEVPFRWPGPI